jgi:hypothetical protein
VSKIHNGHELVEIRTGYEIKEENLKQGQKRMQSVINELDAGEMLINKKQKAESSNRKELHAAINNHKLALKKAIDELSENLLKKVDQKWQTLEDPIQKEQNRIIIMKRNFGMVSKVARSNGIHVSFIALSNCASFLKN